MVKKQYTYGTGDTYLVSSKYTGAQKYAIRVLRSKCKKELIKLGESENPTDPEAFEIMMEGEFISELMVIVHYGQDVSAIDFSKIDYPVVMPAISEFFDMVEKKSSLNLKSAKK